ncbi:MAG: hypothetical protein GKR90_22690 [Pseudomonadales bacterium]|nr:hypothetical protein [Pseudomonadales bacterium]
MNRQHNSIMVCCLLAATVFACSKPDVELGVEAEATDENITIRRDAFGVPHIEVKTKRGAYFASGYVMAEDRLVQTLHAVLFGRGELAQYLGSDYLPYDEYVRLLKYSEEEWQIVENGLHEDLRTFLQGSADGINQYIDEALADPYTKMPYEVRANGLPMDHITPRDLMAAIRHIMWAGPIGLSGGGREIDNLRVYQFLVNKFGEEDGNQIFNDVRPFHDPDAPATIQREDDVHSPAAGQLERPDFGPNLAARNPEPVAGVFPTADTAHYYASRVTDAYLPLMSRGLMIGQSRSATGNPMVMQATADGYDIHISGAGLDVLGLVFPPFSLPLMSRNRDSMWLMQAGSGDTVDIFEERLNPDNRYQYWFKGEWHDMNVRTETINVKDSEPVTMEVVSTVHGPIVGWEEDTGVAYSRASTQWMREQDMTIAMVKRAEAKSLDEMREAATMAHFGSHNVMYAREDGHLEFWHISSEPIRRSDIDPRFPIPGTGEHEWLGVQGPKLWPHVANPTQDYFFNWNSNPSSSYIWGDSQKWGKASKTYLAPQLVESYDVISMADLHDINVAIGRAWGSHDESITAPEFFAEYFADAAAAATDPDVAKAFEYMSSWDGQQIDANGDGYYDDPGQTIFRRWLSVANRIVFDEFSGYSDSPTGTTDLLRVIEGSDAGLPMQYDFLNGEDINSVLRMTVSATIAELRSEFDGDMDQWFEVTVKRNLDDRLFAGAIPAGMGVELDLLPKEVFHNGMPSWNVEVELGAQQAGYKSIIPSGGQSHFINLNGEKAPHFDDQMMKHVRFEMKNVSMDKETILKETKRTYVIKRPAVGDVGAQ